MHLPDTIATASLCKSYQPLRLFDPTLNRAIPNGSLNASRIHAAGRISQQRNADPPIQNLGMTAREYAQLDAQGARSRTVAPEVSELDEHPTIARKMT